MAPDVREAALAHGLRGGSDQWRVRNRMRPRVVTVLARVRAPLAQKLENVRSKGEILCPRACALSRAQARMLS